MLSMPVNSCRRGAVAFLVTCLVAALPRSSSADLPAIPKAAKLAFEEDWSTGRIDAKKWYVLRKRWGEGNNGVVPENVRIERDTVGASEQNVLVCNAHGDEYDGGVFGYEGKRQRVGGVIVSKPFFASGRFEVVMKIGDAAPHDGCPTDPAEPTGSVPAIWTYGYRYVETKSHDIDDFSAEAPFYNPHMKAYGAGANEYWSELDFPEFGKNGEFDRALYNTFCQNRHHPQSLAVRGSADGRYHTFTTEWRTKLVPLDGIRDDQVVEAEGYWWIRDKEVTFGRYLGNPLERRGKNDYLVHTGDRATHWIDGKRIGENKRFVPAMAAQLNLGIWLPAWAGPAKWKTSRVSFASIKVWQYSDEGDVRGILKDDISNNFSADGKPVR
jgi:hypothetical protein